MKNTDLTSLQETEQRDDELSLERKKLVRIKSHDSVLVSKEIEGDIRREKEEEGGRHVTKKQRGLSLDSGLLCT